MLVVVPTVDEMPSECVNLGEAFETQLRDIRDDIQLNSNLIGYLVDPTYPIASDMMGFLSCANDVFSSYCDN